MRQQQDTFLQFYQTEKDRGRGGGGGAATMVKKGGNVTRNLYAFME